MNDTKLNHKKVNLFSPSSKEPFTDASADAGFAMLSKRVSSCENSTNCVGLEFEKLVSKERLNLRLKSLITQKHVFKGTKVWFC